MCMCTAKFSPNSSIMNKWKQSPDHGLINYMYIDAKANCRRPTKLTCKGIVAGVYLSEAPSPPRFLFGAV
jgi:hypothetical protein